MAVLGQLNHWYEVEIGPVPVQVPTFATRVRPTATEVGVKLGAAELLGAIRIGPKDAENVDATPAPTLFVEVVAVTLATKCLPTMAEVSATDAEAAFAITEQPACSVLLDATAEVQEYQA